MTSKQVAIIEMMEREVLAHRYLYYVICAPIISDHSYDELEIAARNVCPPESPVHSIGSELLSSYSAEVIQYAKSLS